MSEEYDYSELRKYLQGQVDLGGADILLDDPWSLNRTSRAAPPAPAPARVQPSAPAAPPPSLPAVPAARPEPAPQPELVSVDMPSARPVKKSTSEFETAESLEAFYASIAKEAVYSATPSLARYEGPERPRLLMLFDSPRADIPAGVFFETPTGQMLSKLFASLHIEQKDIGISYFYKSPVGRNIPPLLETQLRKMLTKELSLVQPEFMVTFGVPVFHRVFGRGKNFEECAGMDMEFGGFKACALVDAFAMTTDKQLKLVTWKVHIPRGTYFKA